MELFHPLAIKILPIFLGVVALSIVLSAVISWLYRDRPEKVWNTWLKLAILLGVIVVLVGTGSLGKWAFLPVALFLAGWGWWELLCCIQTKYGVISHPTLLIGLGTLGILGGLAPTHWTTGLGVAIAAWLALVLPLLIDRQPTPMPAVLGTAFGLIFITLPVALLLALLTNDYGEFSLLVLLVMSHDGFSQGCGLLGGKTLLIPKVSPGKTWFGTVGGILGCLLVGYLLRFLVPEWQPWQVLCVAGITSLMSLCGDLVASSLKREAGIKDFSQVLSVTGGILDKFDSLLFATPLFYFLAHYLRPSG
jgi:phosphatidate cytidylyltransferase